MGGEALLVPISRNAELGLISGGQTPSPAPAVCFSARGRLSAAAHVSRGARLAVLHVADLGPGRHSFEGLRRKERKNKVAPQKMCTCVEACFVEIRWAEGSVGHPPSGPLEPSCRGQHFLMVTKLWEVEGGGTCGSVQTNKCSGAAEPRAQHRATEREMFTICCRHLMSRAPAETMCHFLFLG